MTQECVDEFLAAAWNKSQPDSPANASDFWPLCSQLAEEGLVLGSEEQLATTRIGPFRLAQTEYRAATQDFVEVLLPATMASSVSGQPLQSAIGGLLAASTTTFVRALKRGVLFGRTEQDKVRWVTLSLIKRLNQEGEYPDEASALGAMSAHAPQFDETSVRAALAWLTTDSAPTMFGKELITLIDRRDDGTLHSLV